MTHRMHPLYDNVVCGAKAVPSECVGAPTCLVCATWNAAPLRPGDLWERRTAVSPSRHLNPGDTLVITNKGVYMDAIEEIVVVALDVFPNGFFYAFDDQDRHWPVDLPL